MVCFALVLVPASLCHIFKESVVHEGRYGYALLRTRSRFRWNGCRNAKSSLSKMPLFSEIYSDWQISVVYWKADHSVNDGAEWVVGEPTKLYGALYFSISIPVNSPKWNRAHTVLKLFFRNGCCRNIFHILVLWRLAFHKKKLIRESEDFLSTSHWT